MLNFYMCSYNTVIKLSYSNISNSVTNMVLSAFSHIRVLCSIFLLLFLFCSDRFLYAFLDSLVWVIFIWFWC